jgi:hypothetical protein
MVVRGLMKFEGPGMISFVSTLHTRSERNTDAPAVSFVSLNSLSESLPSAPANLIQTHSPSNLSL